MTTQMQIATDVVSQIAGVELVQDGSALVTAAAVAKSQARTIVAELEASGIEASSAPDHDDRSREWVYVTVSAEKP